MRFKYTNRPMTPDREEAKRLRMFNSPSNLQTPSPVRPLDVEINVRNNDFPQTVMNFRNSVPASLISNYNNVAGSNPSVNAAAAPRQLPTRRRLSFGD